MSNELPGPQHLHLLYPIIRRNPEWFQFISGLETIDQAYLDYCGFKDMLELVMFTMICMAAPDPQGAQLVANWNFPGFEHLTRTILDAPYNRRMATRYLINLWRAKGLL